MYSVIIPMFYALKMMTTDKEIGLRRFYTENRYEKLKNNNLVNQLIDLAHFWDNLNNIQVLKDIEHSHFINLDAAKWLQCLNAYPNEFWKYAISVFFIKNQYSATLKDDLAKLLKQLTAFFICKIFDFANRNKH